MKFRWFVSTLVLVSIASAAFAQFDDLYYDPKATLRSKIRLLNNTILLPNILGTTMIPMNTMMSTMMVITKTTMTINTQVASGVFTALPTA
ncbi:MAG: hypothetical protein IPH36_07645 [Saprospiraceae bacterium]|nr:hypothetical protein [Saprospiraceae bacterium]MBK7787537.1 hypothetical protein [Saprospiraceae bacterium]